MTASNNTETVSNNRHRKKIMWLLILFFLIVGVIFGIYWLVWARFEEYTDDAYVTGNIVPLMSQVPGTIISISTDDAHLVLKGQELIKLDEADMLIALQRSRGKLAETIRQVRQYYEEADRAKASLMLTKANLTKAELDLKRRIGLVGELAISQEEMQHMKTSVAAAKAEHDAAFYKLTSAVALIENASLYTHPLVEQAKADFRRAYLNWVRTTIYAPVTGYVAKRSAQVGQQVNLGTNLLALLPLNEVWVDANYKENQLSHIRIGQPALLVADANGQTYHGTVFGVNPGTGSALALLPPQNATGNWIKIVQRIPVRIAFDAKELAEHPLQVGLSLRVTIDTHSKKGALMSQVVDKKPLYATSVFNDQLANANHEIDIILRQNAPNRTLGKAEA